MYNRCGGSQIEMRLNRTTQTQSDGSPVKSDLEIEQIKKVKKEKESRKMGGKGREP